MGIYLRTFAHLTDQRKLHESLRGTGMLTSVGSQVRLLRTRLSASAGHAKITVFLHEVCFISDALVTH